MTKPPSPESPVPRHAQSTVRQAMAALLEDNPLSAREISAELRISEKEIASHLLHLRRSLQAGGKVLAITPAECRKCGYVFAKRDRLTPPGKCPVCRHSAISEPLFAIHQTG